MPSSRARHKLRMLSLSLYIGRISIPRVGRTSMPPHSDTKLPFQRRLRYDRPGFGTEFDTKMNLDLVRSSRLCRFLLESTQGCFRDLPDISQRIFKPSLRLMDSTPTEYTSRRPPIDLGLICLDDDRRPINVPPQEFTRQ
jgi:hypothetical protein